MRSTNLGRFGTHVIYTYQGRPSATKFWHSWFACRSSYLRLNASVHQLTRRGLSLQRFVINDTILSQTVKVTNTIDMLSVPSTRKMTVKDGRRRVWSKRFAVFCRFQQTDTRWAEVGVRGSNSRSFVDRSIVQPFDVRWYIVVNDRLIDDTQW